MKIPVPPEPVELKREAKAQKKGTDWNMDSLVLWSGNRLPSYLWNEGEWDEIFKREGCDWQCFLKVLSWHKREIIEWARDGISWGELINKIEDFTEGPLFTPCTITSEIF
jgi:hypothetical protein